MSTGKRRAFAVMYRDWHGEASPPAFTDAEKTWMEGMGTVVPHRTYSLQQSDFRAAGYAIDRRLTGQTYMVLGVAEVVCIATEDRYGIFFPHVNVRRYRTVAEWRAATFDDASYLDDQDDDYDFGDYVLVNGVITRKEDGK